jgi:uncharacterized protein (TIGR03437 family)
MRLVIWLACAGCGPAQVITTVAGADFVFPSPPLPAISAPVGYAAGIAVDAKGNVYVPDDGNKLVLRITPDGVLTVVAGNGITGFSGDGGPATGASLSFLTAVTLDTAGNLYLTDGLRIRKVSSGIITTVAGNGKYGFSGDGGPATSAAINVPLGVAVDAAGNLYISDSRNNRIRKVSGGIITTVAGSGSPFQPGGFSGDGGLATNATLNFPSGLAVDTVGNLYIADEDNHRVRKVSGGIITTVAGTGVVGFSGDGGPATSATLDRPNGVALDAAGNLYIACDKIDVRKVTGGTITTIAGRPAFGFSGDGGPAINALFDVIYGIAVDSAANLYIADFNRIRRVTANGIVDTFAGNRRFRFSGDGGAATGATLNLVQPGGIAANASGDLYIADTLTYRVRKVSGGTITTVAGNGSPGFSGDGGPATAASMSSPAAITLDAAGNLYIADGNRIRKVSGGIIMTVAGTGDQGLSGDGGPATSASLNYPVGIAVDAAGNLYIAESSFSNRIRKVSGGIITTLAGTGAYGFSGDGGPATNATFSGALAVAVDRAGNVYIADFNSNRVRKVSGGIITTVVGNGAGEFSGDGGPATSAAIYGPYGLAVDSIGNLYIGDSFNDRVRKVSGGIITTVAGNGTPGFSGDGGLATSAMLTHPAGVTVDAAGNIYISDTYNDRVREVLAAPPQVQASPNQLQFAAASAGSIPPRQTIILASSIPGVSFSAQVDSNANWLSVSPQTGAFPRLLEVTADPANLQPGSYTGTITITTPNATPASSVITVRFTVSAAQAPKLAVDKPSLSFPFPRNGKPRSQPVTVSNAGGGKLPFNVTAQTNAGGNWLSVSPQSGQALPSTPATLTVTADPTGLTPSTYTGSVTISGGGDTQTLPVTMTISSINQAILLSQTGLSFLGVSQGGVIPSQTFGVINIGTGVVNWTVSKSTLTGGNDWLQIGSASGSTDAGGAAVPTVNVSVNPFILPAGKYYGQVRVDSPDAANSPQVVTIFLQVLPAASDIAAVAQPAELLFAASPGGGSPGSEDLMLYNIAAAPKTFRSLVAADPGLTIVTLPTDGTLDPQRPNRLVVQPLTDGLPPGIYSGTVSLQFSDGRVSSLKVSIVVPAGSAATGANAARAANETVCQPTQLLIALTTLGQSFTVSAGWPVALGVDVKDDCGTPLDAGSVTAGFSNGDPPLTLQSVKGGHWETTWMTNSSSTGQVTLKLQATDPPGAVHGERQITGLQQTQTDPPVFDKRGIVSAASGQPFVPLGPGSIVSIYGDRLAQTTLPARAAPLPNKLVSTSVLIAGRLMPLYFVSQNQVNALLPFDLNVNTTQQILILQGPTYSQPVQVDLAPAQPAVFMDTSVAPNQGIIIVVRGQGASQTQFEANPATPARAGDVIVIYCSGLGTVDPAIAAGDPAGLSKLSSTTNPVQVTIGDRNAPVFFAGLAPGFVGLYQINATVPDGVPTGNAIPVTLSVAGQTSPPVVMAIR